MVKRASKIFENSFLKNAILKFRSEALGVSFLTISSNENQDYDQNMISMRIIITNFRDKLRKLSFMLFSYICMM